VSWVQVNDLVERQNRIPDGLKISFGGNLLAPSPPLQVIDDDVFLSLVAKLGGEEVFELASITSASALDTMFPGLGDAEQPRRKHRLANPQRSDYQSVKPGHDWKTYV
jgi:hypothetical protein